MFQVFTDLASWVVFELLGLPPSTKLADALHFFIEDTTKIFALLLVMIYVIAIIRASLDVERVRDYLAGKNRFVGYFFWDQPLVLLPRSVPVPVFRCFLALPRQEYRLVSRWPF